MCVEGRVVTPPSIATLIQLVKGVSRIDVASGPAQVTSLDVSPASSEDQLTGTSHSRQADQGVSA